MLHIVGICVADLSIFEPYKKTCGKTRLRGGTIVGGEAAGEGEFPWLASFQWPHSNHMCGSAIISDRWILTAGHCVEKYELLISSIIPLPQYFACFANRATMLR